MNNPYILRNGQLVPLGKVEAVQSQLKQIGKEIDAHTLRTFEAGVKLIQLTIQDPKTTPEQKARLSQVLKNASDELFQVLDIVNQK